MNKAPNVDALFPQAGAEHRRSRPLRASLSPLLLGIFCGLLFAGGWRRTPALADEGTRSRQIDVGRIIFRADNGDVLWQLVAEGTKDKASLRLQDGAGREVARLTRHDAFMNGESFPSLRVGNEKASVSIGVETRGLGTELPTIELLRATGDKKKMERVGIVLDLEGGRIEGVKPSR